MIRNLVDRLADRSRYRVVSGFEYRVSGLALFWLGAWAFFNHETLSDWLLSTGIVLYGLGFVKKRRNEGNGGLVTVPERSLFAFFWLFLFAVAIFVGLVATMF